MLTPDYQTIKTAKQQQNKMDNTKGKIMIWGIGGLAIGAIVGFGAGWYWFKPAEEKKEEAAAAAAPGHKK